MKTRRIFLPVLEARAGLHLAAEVRNPVGGAVLLPAGTELTDESLAGLRRRGIDVIAADVPDSRSEAEIDQEIARAEARIAHLFHRHQDNPGLQELMQLVLEYRRKSLS